MQGERRSPWKLWVCDPRYMICEGFIVETMGVKFQGQGLGGGVTVQIVCKCFWLLGLGGGVILRTMNV